MVCDMPLATFTDQRWYVCMRMLVAAASLTACSSCSSPDWRAEGLLSSTTLSAMMGATECGVRSMSDRSTSACTIEGLCSAMSMRSGASPAGRATTAVAVAAERCATATLRAVFSVMSELTTHVTSMSTMAPFSTSSPSKRLPSGSIIL